MTRLELKTVAARSAIRAGLSPALAQDDARELLADVLLAQGTPPALAARLVKAATAVGPAVRLIEQLAAALGGELVFQTIEEMLREPILLLLGPRESGKTTLAAKLAARFGEREVLVVSAGLGGLGDAREIEEYTAVLGVPLTIANDVASLRDIISGAAGRRVIIDTAAVAVEEAASRDWLRALIAAAGAEPLLVMPADTQAAAATPIARAAAELGARRLIATRLDLARRVGGMLAAADSGHLALVGTSVTPHFAFGLRPLTPEVLARRLLTVALEVA
jgi:flagellar biosynthesis protein FlhF